MCTQVHLLKPYVEPIAAFATHIFSFPVEDRNDAVISAVVGVLGDMAQRIQESAPFLAQNGAPLPSASPWLFRLRPLPVQSSSAAPYAEPHATHLWEHHPLTFASRAAQARGWRR